MKVLWFEVTQPSNYNNNGEVIGGWQDSLETLIKKYTNIDLYVVFASRNDSEQKIIDGVTYIPILLKYTFSEKITSRFTCEIETSKLLQQAITIIEDIQPDLIHIFGLEWCWGLVSKYTKIPTVLHIMGSMIPYYNALYPPKYNLFSIFKSNFPYLKPFIKSFLDSKFNNSRKIQEREIWKAVSNFMGRTHWDYALSQLMAPNSRYFHVEEALRSSFTENKNYWSLQQGKLRIVSTGCRTYWKGPDMLLKTAKILKQSGLDFEWTVIGNMHPYIKKTVEKIENSKFIDNNVNLLSYKSPKEIANILQSSTIYVHTAYIENSPNSICEAQYLGVPVIATNVGGISTLVENGVDGILVPANDPWTMAYEIISLTKDSNRMLLYSNNSLKKAKKRHNGESIIKELLDCYNSIIN